MRLPDPMPSAQFIKKLFGIRSGSIEVLALKIRDRESAANIGVEGG
jgi:hypothetical protein